MKDTQTSCLYRWELNEITYAMKKKNKTNSLKEEKGK